MSMIQTSSVGRTPTPRNVGRNYQSLFLMLLVSVFLFFGLGTRLVYLQIRMKIIVTLPISYTMSKAG